MYEYIQRKKQVKFKDAYSMEAGQTRCHPQHAKVSYNFSRQSRDHMALKLIVHELDILFIDLPRFHTVFIEKFTCYLLSATL